jgi:ABC-type branched-subunit amino acid transport system substrate-binding protein
MTDEKSQETIWSRRSFLGLMTSGLALAGCMPGGGFPSSGQTGLPSGQQIAPIGDQIGQGATQVALLLPLSATGNAGGKAATGFRNAAEMAISTMGASDVNLIVKDTGGTAQGAGAAASQAVSEGAQMILGPVFSTEVAAVAPIARSAGVPVIAFSSDASVAGRGLYLLSFLPSSDVRRMVYYARNQGKSSLAALLPNTGYGQVVEAALRQVSAQAGIRLALIERYEPDQLKMQEAALRLGNNADQFDALFVPEAGQAMVMLAQTLAGTGINTQTKLILGSGQWEDPAVQNAQVMLGAVYPAPSRQRFGEFASQYASRYGEQPIRVASLGYDSATLAAALARQSSGRIDPSLLLSPNGFTGVDGIFRFLSDGTNQRGLAVYEITGGGTRLIEEAPRSFQTGQF